MARRIIYYVDHGDIAGLIEALQSDERSVHFTDVDGQSLLHAATASKVPSEVAAELIRRGIDINRQDDEGRTALLYSAILKRKDVAELILGAGGRLDVADRHGNQPLWYAVHSQHGNHDLIKLFVQYGANPHHKNAYGKSPIDLARSIGVSELLEILMGACGK